MEARRAAAADSLAAQAAAAAADPGATPPPQPPPQQQQQQAGTGAGHALGPSVFAEYAEVLFPVIVDLLLSTGGAGSNSSGGGGGSGGGDRLAGGGAWTGPRPGAGAAPGVLHYVWRDAALTVLRWDRLFETPPGSRSRLLRPEVQASAEAFLRAMVAAGGAAGTEARRAHVGAASIKLVHAFMERWGRAVCITGAELLPYLAPPSPSAAQGAAAAAPPGSRGRVTGRDYALRVLALALGAGQLGDIARAGHLGESFVVKGRFINI
ncbi:hypothetical protein MNEG_12288 [Monoraphidium neglectum]|uniref:Uncharacterized protein n=1 Tax=Monoraphidium neglectum TaxID=145388 RepID=A0A0D2KIT0_9CHLO|nr:hypothetical protein MNEG_12288 [Monoraphidium neglectum]KIY95673.1 hypothetical protein MNEG_12288 [Monoraphidium neglectum]|eukprot:XP_013894693.1 hypothetical protein MNEG_12288 [Monoraphidium neglectum]